jgi:subtilisin family serine protease
MGWRASICGLLASILILTNGLGAPHEPYLIRLRNAVIQTSVPKEQLAGPQSLESESSGLYLIQFSGPLQADWREQLRAKGVGLLKYVPDEAYLARFSRVRIGELRRLAFVRWVDNYRTEYRVFQKLQTLTTNQVPPEGIAIQVLAAQDATPLEIADLTQLLSSASVVTHPSLGTILRGKADPAQIQALARHPAVLWIEPGPNPRLSDELAVKVVGGQNPTGGHASGVQELGFDGRGVVVSVADSGLNRGDAESMHPDLKDRVDAFFYYGQLENAADEHGHGTHVAGIIAGNGAVGETDENGFLYGLGVAPGSHVIAQRVFDGRGIFSGPFDNEVLTRDAVHSGAVIGSNSWGEDTQGRYDLSAAEFDALVRDADSQTPGDQPYVLVFAAGNAGPGLQTIGSPAIGKNVIATGASQNDRADLFTYTDGPDTMADFSSRGPCEDGRIKPDLVAPGTWIASLQSAAASAESAWWPLSDYYQYEGGTSQAAPHVAGAAAVFVQFYRERITNQSPSPALIKAALINGAVDLDDWSGTAPVPNHSEGWGRVDLTQIISSPRRFEFMDQKALLSTGQVYERRLNVASQDLPLKVTLAYTDCPGLPAAIPSLVNDLDLEVVSPDGSVYHGNQFDQGESVPNTGGTDSINNVEEIRLRSPLPGEYLIRVRAVNVPEDARLDTPATDQDFALVFSGELPLPGMGIVILDRAAYTAPDQVRIKLIDPSLTPQSAVSVWVRSTTDTNGVQVELYAEAQGIFAGKFKLAAAPSQTTNAIQVSNGDQIEVIYNDLEPAGLRVARARIDLEPPVLSEVDITSLFGRIIVTWESDEPSSSQVHFGTSLSSLGQYVRDNALTQTHSVALDALSPNIHYWFYVVSTDEAGNTTTNDNAGAYYDFTAKAAASVLLVNDYMEDPPGSDSVFISLDEYTSALDKTGISYEVWDVNQIGTTPLLANLRPYRTVIWRLNDSFYSTNSTLSFADQAALENYLEGGGSLMVASMQLLSRLGDVPFRTNVLHVQSFIADTGLSAVHGVDYDPVSSHLDVELDYTNYPYDAIRQRGPDLSDSIQPTTNAVAFIYGESPMLAAGVRYPRTGQDSAARVVFLSFPLEAVPNEELPPNTRASLLLNILTFLAPGINGLGTISLDNNEYSSPSRLALEVADSDLAGSRRISVRCASSSDTNGLTVPLQETVRRGLFRGTFTTVGLTNAPAANQLRVREGDEVWAEYYDASNGKLIRAAAVIDTSAPAITQIQVQPSFEDTTIMWTTSEPTDALVQFGESTFLGRTTYRTVLSQYHKLTLSGLMPDRAYNFQVVSRDAAGNTSIDDNHGILYQFRTLKPLSAPWFDDLETPSTNWTVQLGELGGTNGWQLAPVSEGINAKGNTSSNVWQSNPNLESIATADTTLIGPAVELVGGNQAYLRVWHYYDFTPQSHLDLLEIGRINLTTNDGNSWITLKEFTGAIDDWQPVEIDLTPFIGHVVRLGWYYGLFSMQSAGRVGWLIDDISITVANVPLGTILVSNNLSQAQFRVVGPVNRSGRGFSLTMNNAPPGEYSVSFSPIPYYETPAPQTNELRGTNVVLFAASYSYPDVNTNCVSDLWETAFFSGLIPNDTWHTDTDGDGLPDGAEFMAGTNPVDALSTVKLQLPRRIAPSVHRLSWTSVVSYAYQVQNSTNLTDWFPVSDWIRASGTTTSFTLTATTNACLDLFRLQVKP